MYCAIKYFLIYLPLWLVVLEERERSLLHYNYNKDECRFPIEQPIIEYLCAGMVGTVWWIAVCHKL